MRPTSVPVAEQAAGTAGSAGPEVLELIGVTKRFGAQIALDDAGLTLAAGEVHALLGENGSGKSTLIKLLAGFHQPDAVRRAVLRGADLTLGDGGAADAAGIRFVHQDLALVAGLDVAENLALGQRYEGRGWVSDARERRAAQAVLDGLGVDVSARRRVQDLSPTERTMVAVARALRPGAGPVRLLVLDEVTAALPTGEVALVFDLVRRIRDAGGTVLYVTHRLEEVLELADRVTVLRDGRNVTTRPVVGLDHAALVELIVGRPPEELYARPAAPEGAVALRARGLGGATVRDVDLELHRGEIVGVAGLVGSGRDDLPYLLFGAQPWARGNLMVNGRDHVRMTPARAIDEGLALIPADRAGRGSTPRLSLRENLTLPRIRRGRGGWIDARGERRDAERWLRDLRVQPALTETPLAALSGGNQQKVVLARWFRCEPSVLLLDEPTQGIDVGSKAAIYAQLAERSREGMAILLASTDHDELAAVCNRVMVMGEGRVRAVLHGDALTAEAITAQTLAAGKVTIEEVSGSC